MADQGIAKPMVAILLCLAGSLVLAHAEGPVPDDYYDNVSAKKYDDSIGPIIMCINMSICKPNPEPFKNLLGPYGPLPGIQDASIVLQWHELLLGAVRANTSQAPTVVARALYVVQSAVYDAWAAYDEIAVGINWQKDLVYRRPLAQRTLANKEEAISFAAYQATTFLYPNSSHVLQTFLASKGYALSLLGSNDLSIPAGLGNVAAQGVIGFRASDGSNQFDLYRDYSGFKYQNASKLVNASAWQPLPMKNGQQFPFTPFWRLVKPFALEKAAQFLPPLNATFLAGSEGYHIQAEVVLDYSATLEDRTKSIADYWADFSGSNLPAGHWTQYAEYVAHTRGFSLDDNVVLLFTLTGSLLDASISCWDTKYTYVTARPITSIRYIYEDKTILAYERDNGTVFMNGSEWNPFQPSNARTPPFPSFTSGHSTFGGAFEAVMKLFTRSDYFGLQIVIPPNSLVSEEPVPPRKGEPVPAAPLILYYPTFSYASEENGISRLYGGVHYANDNFFGRKAGVAAGIQAYEKVQALLQGEDEFKSSARAQQEFDSFFAQPHVNQVKLQMA